MQQEQKILALAFFSFKNDVSMTIKKLRSQAGKRKEKVIGDFELATLLE